MEELEILHTQQGQGTDLVDPTVEQPAAVESVAPAMEEPPVTGPTSPGDGAHDVGDLGDEGLWSTAATSADPAGEEQGPQGIR